MAVNQQRKKAMKRLATDLDELQQNPVCNVSAAPLDEDMLEWHCNFKMEDIIYHVILFFPENYPYKSPSAEFVPNGFQFIGGATKTGKKGVQVCLSIFSDFADWHKEWANEKGMGWSPGYTVQTVLLNMVAFMADMNERWSSGGSYQSNNAKLTKGFTCEDCGHSWKKPYPPMPTEKELTTPMETDDSSTPQIVDYISKSRFKAVKPRSKEELYGYGIIQSGPPHRPALTSPCEFLMAESYYGMKSSIGQCQSILKENLAFFLPLYIHPLHGKEIKATVEESLREVAKVLPGCKQKKTTIEHMIIKVIPNLMSATVVEFSKGTQHTSDNHLSGYFALHRLFLWAIDNYPELQGKIDDRLQEFIDDEENRSKGACPHIGEWLMLLAGSAKYRWRDAAEAYLSESWRRNVMWYVKDDAKLGYLDTPQKYRLEKTLSATAVSRKLLAFQVLFLDIAMPDDMTRKQIIKRYDENFGFPTEGMVAEMKIACQKIEDMNSYSDWFKVLKLEVPSDDDIQSKLLTAVEYAINTKGYHWSFFKNQGGWKQVLAKYQNGTPNWKGKKASGKVEEKTDKSKGKGAKTAQTARGASTSGAGRGRGRGAAKRKADTDSDSGESDSGEDDSGESEGEEEVVPKGRGRGRGRGKASKIEKEPSVGRGKGKRGGRGGRGGRGERGGRGGRGGRK